MNKNSIYAFYGSLRKGMYNYRHFEHHLEYLFTHDLPGYKMFALARFPLAVKTNQSTDIIKVEIMRITNPETEKQIHELELNEGYVYEGLKIRELEVGIYLFSESKDRNQPTKTLEVIKTGDWVEFFGQNEWYANFICPIVCA